MQAELWRKVEELYHAAMSEPAEKRAEFLDRACSDAHVRAEVQSLLNQADGSFLERSPLPSMVRPGMKLGNFELVGRIGRGGMGEVWRAHDPRLKRNVAIKLLPAAFARDPERIARFEHEAWAASALNHPNIVSVFDVGHEKGTWWIVSELVEGKPLNELIRRGPLPVRRVIEIGTEIAEGLAAAHAAGIVHRDLKPGNVMVRRDGGVKIVDFGLAKRERSTQENTTPTDSGAIVGTPGYMSPEQVRGEGVDARSDIFSFGVILYEMLSGRQAFTGTSSVEVMNAILKDEPAELTGLHSGLDRIVRHCMEKEPSRRFQSAADLSFALGSALVSPAVTERLRKHRPWSVWATIVIALAAATAFYLWQSHLPRTRITPIANFRRLTNDRGLTAGAAISTDGKLVAYSSDRDNPTNLDLYVQQVDGGGVARITDDPADDYDPSFSPDGTQIAFRSDRGGGGVFIVPTIGGEARMLVPEGRRPRFSPDGQRLLYWTGSQPHDVRGSAEIQLWVRPTSGGEPVHIAAGCRFFEKTPVWSPDGSRILFIGTCGSELQTRGLSGWVSTADGKVLHPNRELERLWPSIHHGYVIDQWMGSPSRLLIPIGVGDATSITSVPVSVDGTRVTGTPQRLSFAGGSASRVSADTHERMVLSLETSESHIWSVPIDSNAKALGPPRQLTDGPAGEGFFSLSADGEKLAFLSSRTDEERLFYKDLVTGRVKEVSTEGYRYATPIFSPDGAKVLCVVYPNAKSWHNFIFEIPVSGGVSRKVWDKATFSWLWDWSPDGLTILLEDGPPGISELELPSRASAQILADDSDHPSRAHFSHDGKWVVFESEPKTEYIAEPTRTKLFVAPFRKRLVPRSDWIQVSGARWESAPRFSHTDRLIIFISNRDGFNCIWAQRVTPDMHPDGAPFPVQHEHERRYLISNYDIAVSPHAVVFDRWGLSGNIWVMDPSKDAR